MSPALLVRSIYRAGFWSGFKTNACWGLPSPHSELEHDLWGEHNKFCDNDFYFAFANSQVTNAVLQDIADPAYTGNRWVTFMACGPVRISPHQAVFWRGDGTTVVECQEWPFGGTPIDY